MTATHTEIKHSVFRPTLPEPEELLDGMRRIFESGRVTVGEQVRLLEEGVRARTGVTHSVAVSSGTSGLMLLIRALGLPPGSEVITPSFTFAATSHALLWNGLKPVFCDIEEDGFTMDPSRIEELITPRTSAIYPVCVFGVPGDIDAYKRIADEHDLVLLFDSAQGLGSTYKGRALGNFGEGEVFSLSPTKVVTAMEGGLITTNDDDLAARLRYMRDYGKSPDGEDMRWLGLSARMTEINALVGQWSLARLDRWLENRGEIMNRYHMHLSELPGIGFQGVPPYCTSSRNYMVILVDPAVSRMTRDDLHTLLMEDGVQTKRYFYPALHNQTLYLETVPDYYGQCPVSERIASRSLALPMYSEMPLEAVDDICRRIARIYLRIS